MFCSSGLGWLHMILHWVIWRFHLDNHKIGERERESWELIEREMLWMHVWNSRQSWISWCYRISISKWTIGPGAVSVVSADPREFSSKMNLTRGRLLTRRRVLCRYIYIYTFMHNYLILLVYGYRFVVSTVWK